MRPLSSPLAFAHKLSFLALHWFATESIVEFFTEVCLLLESPLCLSYYLVPKPSSSYLPQGKARCVRGWPSTRYKSSKGMVHCVLLNARVSHGNPLQDTKAASLVLKGMVHVLQRTSGCWRGTTIQAYNPYSGGMRFWSLCAPSTCGPTTSLSDETSMV